MAKSQTKTRHCHCKTGRGYIFASSVAFGLCLCQAQKLLPTGHSPGAAELQLNGFDVFLVFAISWLSWVSFNHRPSGGMEFGYIKSFMEKNAFSKLFAS